MTPYEPSETFNIVDYFLTDRLREDLGDRVALRLSDGERTYADVDRLADRFGLALRDLGVRQEERVLVALPDGEAFAAALFGTLKLGAVVVMVNPALPVDNLAGIVGYARPGAAMVDAEVAERFTEAAAVAGRRLPLLIARAPEGERGIGLFGGDGEALGPGEHEPLTTAATHRDDPAIWLFSGGTTGRPKAVVQPHRSFANTCECYAKQVIGYGPDDISMSVPKLYFGYATGSNLLFPFAAGGSAALFAEHPTADVLFSQIRRHRPTILVNVPKIIAEMVDHPDAGEQDLSCLRLATSAGEALPPALYDRWRETFGVELLDGLGTAEMWHVFVSNRPGAVRPGTLGVAVPGFDVRVRDSKGGEVPDGEVGRLWVRGGSRALGYWQDLPRSAEAFRGEWFAAGDMVSRAGDGYVTYVGRADDALKVGGKWLLPAEVEGCLQSHPGVAECAVVGVPDARGLVKPVAFVVVAGAADAAAGTGGDAAGTGAAVGTGDAAGTGAAAGTGGDAGTDADTRFAEELKAYALERLEPYKHPREVHIVEALPRTHLGKVDRGALKRLAGSTS